MLGTNYSVHMLKENTDAFFSETIYLWTICEALNLNPP